MNHTAPATPTKVLFTHTPLLFFVSTHAPQLSVYLRVPLCTCTEIKLRSDCPVLACCVYIFNSISILDAQSNPIPSIPLQERKDTMLYLICYYTNYVCWVVFRVVNCIYLLVILFAIVVPSYKVRHDKEHTLENEMECFMGAGEHEGGAS